MENEFEKNVKNIVWSLRQIASLIYKSSREMKQKFGVTGPQSLVLKLLLDSGLEKPLSSVDVSRSLKVTPSNITGIIDRLEAKGLVSRKPKEGDRRIMYIVPTEEGIQFGRNLPDVVEEKIIKGLKDLSEEDISSIYFSLSKIIDIVGKEEIVSVSPDHLS
ncbi:MAG: MarR family transcriptional regulator [Candidatus Aminicenantes bacterium]|nr:MarR family transcriptional regulator [Candidatus Aminicenantes bacterium]